MNKTIMACNERIISNIRDVLKSELDTQIKEVKDIGDPDVLDIDSNLVDCHLLCLKFLDSDYFHRSENYLENHMPLNKFNMFIWKILYRIDLRRKQSDLNRLFKLITKYSEDWC